MKYEDIKVGGFYVKKDGSLVREILSDDGSDVEWLSYDLHDGSSWGDTSKCSKASLASWAGRETKPEEVARMDRAGAHQMVRGKERAILREIVPAALKMAPDEELLAEVRRRGLTL